MSEVVNLLPWRESRHRLCIRRVLMMLALLIVLSLIGNYLPITWYQHKIVDISHTKLQWQDKLLEQRAAYDKWQQLAQHDKQIEHTFKALSLRIRRQNQPIALMNVVPRLLPQDTQLNTMRWFQHRADIVGRIENKAALGQLVNALQTAKLFKTVALSSVMVTQKEPVEHIFKLSVGFTGEYADEHH
ncbi:MAG: PilN domain-containing protein [Vibrio sp.]